MYVVFEGIDGCGKDTQAGMLARRLKNPASCLLCSEPDSAGPVGAYLRHLLKTGGKQEAHAALFLADRMISLDKSDKTDHVVQTRSFLSSLVYQQDQWFLQDLIDLHKIYFSRCAIDVIFILDVEPEVGMSRVQGRGAVIEHYETLEKQRTNRGRYLQLAGDVFGSAEIIVLMTTGKTPEEVHAEVVSELEVRYGPIPQLEEPDVCRTTE